jgi:hypothetical protein
MTGIYETYDDEIVAILDARSPECVESAHIEGRRVPSSSESALPLPDSHDPSPD